MMEEPIEAAGALAVWHAEVGRGERSTKFFDPLWEAACLEARASDMIGLGAIGAANEDRLHAASILLRYLVQKAA